MASLAAVTMIAATPGKAAAKHRTHLAHHHCMCRLAQGAEVAAPAASHLGPMRYYGGPKSPMWREVQVADDPAPTAPSQGGMRYYGGPKSPMWRQ